MREILFRGQTRRLGEKVRMNGEKVPSNWVYGGICQGKCDFSIIYGSMDMELEQPTEKRLVYTDTIGQYTGLTDKNGKKIFEGDIVKYGDTINKVVFEQRNGTAYFGVVMDDTETWSFCHLTSAEGMEVIGNIHDNPELLERSGNNE